MKTLYIVRHAKSSWSAFNQSDHERQLSEVGQECTKKIISYLHQKEPKPQLILSSSAKRTMDTALLLVSGLGLKNDIIKAESALYLADEDKILEEVSLQPDEIEVLMIVGHNPGITGFVNLFLKKPIDWLPTSAVVCLAFDIAEWQNIQHAKASLRFIIYPKELSSHSKNNLNV